MSLVDLGRYDMVSPRGLDAACELVASRRAAGEAVLLLAGGTDLFVELGTAPVCPEDARLPLVVDVSRVAELRDITWDGRVVRIGAGATYREIARHPEVRRRLPLLERVTHDIGGPTIQARGTLGGNLGTASPAADGVAAIAAHGAVVVVTSVRGERHIPFDELQTGYKRSSRAPDEIIRAIEIAPPPAGARWYWRKVGGRLAQAISKVALAAVAELDGGRVRRAALAAASVAPVTALMPRTRELVCSRPLAEIDGDTLAAVVDADASPIDDVRSTRDYRLHCLRALLSEFLRDLGAPLP